jgi:predicted Zn-dependent peptidase
MRNLKLIGSVLEKEKGAVVGELRRALDNPARMAHDELMRLSFNVAPYRYTVLGTEAEIKGFTLAEAQYFYRTFYAPNNATLIVIGDVEGPALMAAVQKYYGDMKSQEIPKTIIPNEPLPTKERRFEGAHKQATSEILTIAYPIPSVSHADAVPLALLATHLSRGTEAALRKLLVDTGIAVGASADTSFEPNLFEFSVHLVEGKKAEEALTVIDKAIADMKAQPISKESFERALNQELLNLYGDISDNSELGNWLGEYYMLSGNYMRGFEIIDGFKKSDAEALQNVAKKYLIESQRSIVMVRPEAKQQAKAPQKKERT